MVGVNIKNIFELKPACSAVKDWSDETEADRSTE